MKPYDTRRTQLPLLFAVFSAVATVAIAAYALWHTPSFGMSLTVEGFARLAFYSVAVLAFEQPDGLADPYFLWAWARMGAAAFSVSTGLAVAVELEGLLRITLMRAMMELRGRPPAILLGLGWIGAPISSTLRSAGRPVFAIATDEQSPLVAEARRMGILMVIGDATDPRTRDRVPLARAREVFVATGDDALNVELAGNLLEASQKWRRRGDALRCYVHITDPKFAETLGWQQIWSYESKHVRLVPFSYQELAARDLFFGDRGLVADEALRPLGQQPFHLVVVGFGFMGRTVARHLARFAHFASLCRPRLTVIDDDESAFKAFLEQYPAYSPSRLDLGSPELRSTGSDVWDNYVGRPEAPRQQVDADQAVEYAVHAEVLQLPGDLAAQSLSDKILERAAPLDDVTPVRMAVVVCLEEDRASFEAALRIQHALAAARAERPAAEQPGPVPVYVHLPERGLAAVLQQTDAASWLTPQHQTRDQDFPVRVFGIRDEVASYQHVAETAEQQHATRSQALYRLLSPLRAAHDHLDFSTSNLDAALHAAVKCAAVGITLRPKSEPAPKGATPVLEPLFTRTVDTAVAKLVRRHPKGVTRQMLTGLDPDVRERLVLHGHVAEESVSLDGDTVVFDILDAAIQRIQGELKDRGHDPDLPAKMEHNRWMGERLLKGWRFGLRDDVRRLRESMVHWDALDDRDRRHDRVSLLRFLVEAHRGNLIATWDSR
ncbi:MAG: NAD-binding protein [Myxococcota bacterium]